MAEKTKAITKKEQKNDEEKVGIREISQLKIKTVNELVEKIKNSKTVLIASTRGLPSSQYHLIKKKLRGKADVRVAKRSLVLRAIGNVEKGALQNLKESIQADFALFFSDMDAFELSGWLTDNQSPTKARVGDIAPEDITIEPGPTDLPPGPAISELSGVGLKVAVESGKIVVKIAKVVAKKGEKISEKVANVLSKLNVSPMKVGFEPIAAYSSDDDKIYPNIKIDKEGTLLALREFIGKALGFAVNVSYACKETITYFIVKANAEERALQRIINEKSPKPAEENTTQQETKSEEVKQ